MSLRLHEQIQRMNILMENKIHYSAVVLTDTSRMILLETFDEDIPMDWKKIAHHMTIVFGEEVPNKHDLGKEVELTVTEFGVSDMAIAVKVIGYPSKNAIPHVTLAVNPDGGKPVMSNQITDWYTVEPLKIFGVVSEIY